MFSGIWEKLQELAFPVSEVERKTTGLFFQIIKHIVKIVRYKDSLNCEKHIRDIENWLTRTSDLLFASRSKVSKSKLMKWYKIDSLETYLKGIILRLDRRYESLPVKRQSEEVIHITKNLVRKILEILSERDISKSEEQLEYLIRQLQDFCSENQNKGG